MSDVPFDVKLCFLLVSRWEFQSWSFVFDTEYKAKQKMVQINAFELSFNLQYQPTLCIAWFSCNLQKFITDFRQITPNIANAWCSALWGQTAALDRFSAWAFILSFFPIVWAAGAAPQSHTGVREGGRANTKREKKYHDCCHMGDSSCWSHCHFYIMSLKFLN